ncbi:MAG TPA: hypothetical protein VK386_08235, partial [Acidimicrobiales bacterium]|nr:hypothetical protein [Acidimicrobiales bacterium]
YHWNGNSGPNLTVQIDFAIWISIITGGALLLVWYARSRRDDHPFSAADYFDVRALTVLGASMVVYLFLQLRVSAFVYRTLTPLKIIDYPYRMLALITPIGVLLAVAVAEALSRRYQRRRFVAWLPAPWLASLVLLSPLTSTTLPAFGYTFPSGHPGREVFIPSTEFFKLPETFTFGHSLPVLSGGTLFSEYLPKVVHADGHEINPDVRVYRELDNAGKLAEALGSAQCSVTEPSRTPIEALNIRLTVECDRPTELALPISYNAYTRITAQSADGRRTSVRELHRKTDPRIIIDVPSDRRETLLVSLPDIWRVIF